MNQETLSRRMFKLVIQRGRSERRGEAYRVSYVEPLKFTTRRLRSVTFVDAAEIVRRQCLARTKLEAIFNILPY